MGRLEELSILPSEGGLKMSLSSECSASSILLAVSSGKDGSPGSWRLVQPFQVEGVLRRQGRAHADEGTSERMVLREVSVFEFRLPRESRLEEILWEWRGAGQGNAIVGTLLVPGSGAL